MNIKQSNKTLKQEVWRSEAYFLLAKKGSLDINNIGMETLYQYAMKAEGILDLGCGEGTRLNWLLTKKQKGVGVDISSKALEMGRKSYAKIKFIQADLEEIPLKDTSFELVYSAFVFEHLTDPVKALNEAIRLTTKKGWLILLAPNYGAPNRASPPFKGSRTKKLVGGFIRDFLDLIDAKRLKWNRVVPISDKYHHEMDWDTTVEPYLGNLLYHLKSLGLEIEQYSSCWSEELPGAKSHQKLFKFLGERGVYPFNLWGPHLLAVARKIK